MTSAERQRRCRERRRRREAVYQIAIRDRTVVTMIEIGRLTAAQAADRAHVELELGAMLEEYSQMLRKISVAA